MVIKNGEGKVVENYTAVDDYKAYYIELPGYTLVNEGTLKGADLVNDVSWNQLCIGRLVVNSPGVYDIGKYGGQRIEGLWGDGTVTCSATDGAQLLCIYADKCTDTTATYHAPAQFSGLLTGSKARLCTYDTFDLLSTESTCAGDQCLGVCDVGIMSFGNENGASSLGSNGYNSRATPVKLRYLGTGETSTRPFHFSANSGVWTIDAGTTGGLTLKGRIYVSDMNPSCTYHTLDLSGNNTTRCSVTGTITDWKAGGKKMPIYIKKTGTGTWQLGSGSNGDYSGLVSVENGTLEYTSVAPKGTNTSLGNATNTSDYAILLGSSATAGTFKYVGSADATVTTRPIALTGKGGRLVADAGELDWTGVSSASASTLYLAGATNTNIVRDVSGATSVVKEGDGTWILDGKNDFTGSLTVNGGEVYALGDISEKSDFDFRWFKLVFQGKRTLSYADDDVELEELAFYNASGDRQMSGLTLAKGTDYDTKVKNNGYVPLPDLSNIQPGQYGWLKCCSRTTYTPFTNRDADNLFDDYVSPVGCCVGVGKPLRGDPATWWELLVRLPTGYPWITSFDLCSKGNANRYPTAWTMMGSVDGVVWQTVKTFDVTDAEMFSGGKWYSDQTSFSAGAKRTGYPSIAAEDAASTVGRLANVTKATVGAGGTLRMVGKADFPVVELAGGTFSVDSGTTNTYASLVVTAPKSKLVIPSQAKVTVTSSATAWSGDAALEVAIAGGAFGCDASSGLRRKTKIAITDGGQLIVPAGQTLRVAELTVDGTQQATGSYSGVSWIQGAGTVHCGPNGLAVILK